MPVYSPVSLRGVWAAARGAAHPGRDHALRDAISLLMAKYAADRVVLCGSGTQALQLALEITRARPDDSTVALPAFTCYDVGSAAVGAKARVLLYDIDPGTLSPDYDSLTLALKAGARVVVVSPLYGIPIDWESLNQCIAPYGAVAIEDAAQGHGASWRGRPLGSLGPLSVLSFGRGKGWTGIRGGALLVRDASYATSRSGSRTGISAELKVTMIAVAQWALGRPGLFAIPASLPWLNLGETIYRDPSPIEAITTAAAALIHELYQASAREADARRSNARVILGQLRARPHVQPMDVAADARPGYLRLPFRVSRGLAGFADPAAATRLGIARSYPTTLAALSDVQARLAQAEGSWPGGETLSRELVTVPTHSQLTANEQEELLRLLNNYAV